MIRSPLASLPMMSHRTSAIEITILFTAFIASTYGFGIYLFASLVPEMRQELALDYATIGLATGIAQAGFLVASLLSGLLAPNVGPMRLIFGSAAATAVSLLLMSRIPALGSTPVLIALLTVMGAAAAAVWVPMVAIAQQAIPPRHRAKALGLMSSGTGYGVFLNGLIIPPLVSGYGWRSVWLVVGCIALLLFAFSWLRLRRLGRMTAGRAVEGALGQAQPATLRARLGNLYRPLAGLMILTMFLNGLACMPFQTYLVPLLREDLGHPIEAATRIWSVIGGVGMTSGFLMGWLADRISIKWAMVITYILLSAAASLILALAMLNGPGLVLIYLVGVLFALAFNAIFGLVPAYISANFRGESATLLFGVGNIALGLGGLLGNVIGGFAKAETGSFTPIYMIVAASALALIGLALVTPNERAGGALIPQHQ